jgi:stress response protein YsnF
MASENVTGRLQELGGSDFKIVEGEPNIKGWDVKDENGKKIGEVDELIFDTQSRKVRYIVVDLEGNVFDLDTRDVLVPIGIAQLHEKDDDVILPGVTADQIRALPEYHKDQLDSNVEARIRNVFAGLGTTGFAAGAYSPSEQTTVDTTRPVGVDESIDERDNDWYQHPHFSDDRFYRDRNVSSDENATIPIIKEDVQIGKKEVETGGIRLNSRIVENPVEKDINLREERVNVESTSVDRPASEADLREQEIEMTEKKEVPVVNKEARVVEEVSLNKDVNEREETIRETVRNTDVDIENIREKDFDKNDRTTDL